MRTPESKIAFLESLLGVDPEDPNLQDNAFSDMQYRIVKAESLHHLMRALLIELEGLAILPTGSTERIVLRAQILEQEHLLELVNTTLSMLPPDDVNYVRVQQRQTFIQSNLVVIRQKLHELSQRGVE